MKNTLKKLALAWMAVVMTVSMSVTVFAEEAAPEQVQEAVVESTPEVKQVETPAPTPEVTVAPTVVATAEPTAEVTVQPTAEPTVEATVEPTAEPTAEATVEPTAEPTAEATVEPTAEPTTEVTVQPTVEATETPAVPFTGTVEVELVNTGDLYYGDTITLRAVVRNANTAYAIRWESNDGNGWVEIKGEDKDEYKFIVTEENADLEYRVVLITEA